MVRADSGTLGENLDAMKKPTGCRSLQDLVTVQTEIARERKQYYLLDVLRGRWEFPELMKQALGIAERWRATTVIVEDASSGAALLQMLRPNCPFNLLARKPRLEKQVRASAQSACFESGRVLLPHEAPWLADYERELLGFPSAKYDDQVDSTTQFLEWAQERAAYEAPILPGIWGFQDRPQWMRDIGSGSF
jgi:predicted phage terminase large subunit-like protein